VEWVLVMVWVVPWVPMVLYLAILWRYRWAGTRWLENGVGYVMCVVGMGPVSLDLDFELDKRWGHS
jgi:hypothetical protein